MDLYSELLKFIINGKFNNNGLTKSIAGKAWISAAIVKIGNKSPSHLAYLVFYLNDQTSAYHSLINS